MKNVMDREDVGAAILDLLAAAWMVAMPLIACALLCAGCATKTRGVNVDGMFTEATAGLLALGSVDVMASPVGEETVVGSYVEDTAWLSPSTKTRAVKFQITGTNTCAKADLIVKAICDALKDGGTPATNANAFTATAISP